MTTAVFDLQLPPQCPPVHSPGFAGKAHRVCKNNPLNSADLKTHLEAGTALGADDCIRGSVSLFETEAQARHLMAMRPHCGKFVAVVSLTSQDGVISLPSKTGHIDWWPYLGMRNPANFQVLP